MLKYHSAQMHRQMHSLQKRFIEETAAKIKELEKLGFEVAWLQDEMLVKKRE